MLASACMINRNMRCIETNGYEETSEASPD